MDQDFHRYLRPTAIIDSDHAAVVTFALNTVGDVKEPVERTIKLYLAVRDGIRYDPYSPFHLPEHYRASSVLQRQRSFCIPKASLLCALGRVCGVPSRIGFGTVRNHLATKQLIDYMGSNVFVYHGFVEFYLEGKWVKATPAFNKELCARHQVPPLEFNGREDSLFQPFNLNKQKFMEYEEYSGSYADIPVAVILEAWNRAYGERRVQSWIATMEAGEDVRKRDFASEDILSI
jgi:transglutaminase-like putative cysteine protease